VDRRLFLASAAGFAATARAQAPRQEGPAAPRCYQLGERIDADVTLLDSSLREVRLLDLATPGTKLLYLLIFGGAAGGSEKALWCGDSREDLGIHTAMRARFAARGVAFVVVATPPVYSASRHGYEEGVFLESAADAPRFRAAVQEFVARTEALRRGGALPFETVYYDPRFRLLDNPRQGPHVAAYGPVLPWQGRFKACADRQRHGTPTLWLLAPDGRVLREPFWGNVYDREEQRIRYTEADVATAVEKILEG